MYEARTALPHEKAAAMDRLDKEIDRVRAHTNYSRAQVKECLFRDGYVEYAKRRKLQERTGF